MYYSQKQLNTINFLWFLAIVFFYDYNKYFGWNLYPLSFLELVFDFISVFLFLLPFITAKYFRIHIEKIPFKCNVVYKLENEQDLTLSLVDPFLFLHFLKALSLSENHYVLTGDLKLTKENKEEKNNV